MDKMCIRYANHRYGAFYRQVVYLTSCHLANCDTSLLILKALLRSPFPSSGI